MRNAQLTEEKNDFLVMRLLSNGRFPSYIEKKEIIWVFFGLSLASI